MRFISWNVNGLRAILKKDFLEVFDTFDADIFALQETKCQNGQVDLDLPEYHQYFNCAERKGYAGTAVFCKQKPSREIYKFGITELDGEGRLIALEFEKFWFVDVYTPNSQSELARIDLRMQFDDAFRAFCKDLEAGILPDGTQSTPKPVVMCGDFNVAHQEIDLKNPKTNRGNAGFSDEEREKFKALLDAGFTDTFRYLHPNETGAYSWWSYRFNARQNNAGWRIDYFLISNSIVDRLESASIYNEIYGSDHCPVGIQLAL